MIKKGSIGTQAEILRNQYYVVRESNKLPFNVKKGILIPRPDTETLVEAILNETLPENAKILDLGAGSGRTQGSAFK